MHLTSGAVLPVRSNSRLCYYPTLWYPVPSSLSSPLLLPYPLVPRAQFAIIASATTLPSGTPCPVRYHRLCYYPTLWYPVPSSLSSPLLLPYPLVPGAQFAIIASATTLPSGTPCPVRYHRLCYYPTLWYSVPSSLSSPLLLPYPLVLRAQFAIIASATTLPSGTPCPVRYHRLCYYPTLWYPVPSSLSSPLPLPYPLVLRAQFAIIASATTLPPGTQRTVPVSLTHTNMYTVTILLIIMMSR